ncbi:hypothetical protein AB834_05415 [PVC group bacterium (ex Bugula neritina AB1)]|nr:hypothetical protein AB834_05415 [PVC group bacterium (ex Bugula neritina AB1)]
MSLKFFHLFFIFACICMTAFLGSWFLAQKQLFFAILTFSFLVFLIGYMRKFWLWVSSFSLFFLASSCLFSCSVCFGDSESLAVKGMSNGILFLLVFTMFLWLCFGSFFFLLWKKQKSFIENKDLLKV